MIVAEFLPADGGLAKQRICVAQRELPLRSIVWWQLLASVWSCGSPRVVGAHRAPPPQPRVANAGGAGILNKPESPFDIHTTARFQQQCQWFLSNVITQT
jgi:hypothetical protein